jgi:3',5'-cyclic AMP phosphodiesterase CpdA
VAFQILHLSDFHFCTVPRRVNPWKIVKQRLRERFADQPALTLNPTIWLPESHCPDLARQVARKAFQLRRQIDLMVISGDLATTGLDEDLKIAQGYINTPAQRQYLTENGTATLNFSRARIFLMPGNHDRFDDLRATAGGTNFNTVFLGLWGLSDHEISWALLKSPMSPHLA